MTLDELGARGAGGDPDELDRRIAAVADDDGCLIIYTSGTTGRPKGVLLTNRGFAAGRTSTRDMQLFGRGDSVYLYLPLAHVFGQICQAATAGGRRGAGVLGRRPQPDHRRAAARCTRPCCRRCRGSSRRSTPWRWRSSRRAADAAAAADLARGARSATLGVHRRDVHRGGTGGVRPGRRRDVPARARHLRWQRQTGGLRRRADRARDPAVLLRRRRAR